MFQNKILVYWNVKLKLKNNWFLFEWNWSESNVLRSFWIYIQILHLEEYFIKDLNDDPQEPTKEIIVFFLLISET